MPGAPKEFVRLICDPEIGFVGFPRFEIIAGNEVRVGCAIEQKHRHDGFRHTSTDRNRAVILENHRFAAAERLGNFNSVFGLIDNWLPRTGTPPRSAIDDGLNVSSFLSVADKMTTWGGWA